MIKLLFVLFAILFVSACGKNQPDNPQLPNMTLIEVERQRADQDEDDIPDLNEIDKTRLIIQVPKLRLGEKTKVDLTFFFKNGPASVRNNALFSIIEAPIMVLDIIAKKVGEKREIQGEFFQKMAEMENCWVMKDLFHSLNRPKITDALLRLSVKIQPEVQLSGVPELHHISEIKLKAFSLGENGDIAYLEQAPRWIDQFGADIELPSLDSQGGYQNGSMNIDFDPDRGLEFLLGRKRQLGFCINDFSYQINQKKRILSHAIKKAKLNGVALNYSNGLKFTKIYYVKNISLEELFESLGKEPEISSEGKFVLDSRVHTRFDIGRIESLMDEDLQHGPWIPVTEMNSQAFEGDSYSSSEHLSAFLKQKFVPKIEVGVFAVPIYKILHGVYGNMNFALESRNRGGAHQLHFPKLTPGGEFDLILSAQESVPIASDLKIISVEACINMARHGRDKGQECGDDYRGWCGVYHRDLIYMDRIKSLREDILNDVEVITGERHFSLRQFIDKRFTVIDNLGRLHIRFRAPLTLTSMTWILPEFSSDYPVTFGFDHFENCEHRKRGRNFRFINYPGTVTGNQKSKIKWQLQTMQ
ncbi:MAG: hypothetical protein HYV97_00105 [Bdellovibrio sp.]|nr:hypothetical protein [Bdellovibrio sp.]